jgi:hypothetical protein
LAPIENVYSALTLASNVEGVVFFSASPYGGSTNKAVTLGKPCTASVDPIKCRSTIDAYAQPASLPPAPPPPPQIGWDEFPSGQVRSSVGFAIVTKGDSIQEVRSLGALLPLIAPIETAQEAQAWAQLNFKGATCESTNNAQTGNASYQLRSVTTECVSDAKGSFDVTTETVYTVSVNGDIITTSTKELSRKPTAACPVAGRNPFSPIAHATASTADVCGRYLGTMAHLEGCAVLAFEELAQELVRFGAPESLISRAKEAADDERRHQATMTSYARMYGADVAAAQSSPHRYASLFELALHNAQEGCVRETYGALVALHQAARAGDAALRSDLVQIAQEEVRHAEWSHDLALWLETQLTEAENLQVQLAKRQALLQLHQENQQNPERALQDSVGLPSAEVAAHLFAGLETLILQAAA